MQTAKLAELTVTLLSIRGMNCAGCYLVCYKFERQLCLCLCSCVLEHVAREPHEGLIQFNGEISVRAGLLWLTVVSLTAVVASTLQLSMSLSEA